MTYYQRLILALSAYYVWADEAEMNETIKRDATRYKKLRQANRALVDRHNANIAVIGNNLHLPEHTIEGRNRTAVNNWIKNHKRY